MDGDNDQQTGWRNKPRKVVHLMATMTDKPSKPDTASITLSREDAKIVRDALKVLRNTRLYAFKDQDEDIRQTHATMLDAAERLDAALKEMFDD